MASKEYHQLLEKLKSRPPSEYQPIAKVREGFEKLFAAFPPASDVVFEPFSIDSIPVCWVIAPGASLMKVILFFHGGGFNAGSIDSHRDVMGRISQASGHAVLAIDYRLAPEHPFPAALEDILKVYQWLLENRYPSSDLAFAGSSAGGGLALSLCLKLKQNGLPQPSKVACICPMVDLTLSSESIKRNKASDWVRVDKLSASVKDYAQGKDLTDPLISPFFGDFHGLPPLFIQVGSAEVLRDEVVTTAEKAKAQGVKVTLEEWPEMVHCWQLFAAKVPEGREAIDHIGKFLR